MSKTPMLDKINALIEWLKQGRLSISFKEAQWLCEQIQDMQDEIKHLKETNEEHRKINGILRHNEEILHNKNVESQQRIDKAVEVYDRSIDYLTTINTEFWDMDGNTRQTILDIINRFEKELNILKGELDG